MTRRVVKTCLSLALASAASHGFASGFAINEQSVSSMGTAFAGRSSSADDASTVFGNPAGMARIKREQVSSGIALIHAKTDIDNASGSARGSNDGDMVPFIGAPMGYYVKPLDDNWSFGLGLYVPFGLVTDYERSFQGRYHGDRSEVRVITLQPTLSYRFNEQLSIGFGPTINRIDGELTSAINNPIPGAGDGKVEIKGDDTALGYNVGVLFEVTPQTRFGLTYHSKVDYRLKGDTTVSGPGFVIGSSAGTYDASLELTTPESVDFSVTHELNADWTLYAGSTWTRWSRLEEIRADNKGVGGLLGGALSSISEPQNWHDTWAHAVGAAYKLNPQWTLRAGLAVDQSPTNNVDRSPRIPTGDRTIFSLGTAWSPNDDVTIDLAYSYLMEDDAHIERDDYRATYKNTAHGLGAQVTYRF
ncbi:Long-chain fatty acid transport protein [Pseudomonas sp. HMWF032]|uniref:OmpP1/FadL family transporter n=1 Tax=unclassified Pseudomonas TaxID=196821 RepID=UPI000D3A81E9|nr:MULTISPECIES: outer membrane protein transport protein [unclassified Pseudomonas]PTS84339.1 Long-chain fatty acid transport protein [Pseudomonas sp. HMWF032]PTT77830.1 Long-chain fatty acid transport protein [Pseudomonas sp. HMWF010]WAC44332.1 outer membrane protein transport protein [Pseudomonas sp. SL4(2022)]